MTIPIQISFHGVERTENIEDYVRRRAEKLGLLGRIVSCRVAVEAPHKHKTHGNHFRVRVDLAVPGSEIVVDRSPDEGRAHEDLYATIDHVFDSVVRRLRDESDRKRPPHERIER